MSDRSPADAAAPTAAAAPEADAAAEPGGEDVLGWARRVWDDRDAWLDSRGGVESVFMAAQLLGCRDDAVRWLRQRTRV